MIFRTSDREYYYKVVSSAFLMGFAALMKIERLNENLPFEI